MTRIPLIYLIVPKYGTYVFKLLDKITHSNGAGKTTFAREYLPREDDCPDFINVELIAAGLSPFDPAKAFLRAGRLVLQEIHRRIRMGESFAFETTLSGRRRARRIPLWRNAGYHVKMSR